LEELDTNLVKQMGEHARVGPVCSILTHSSHHILLIGHSGHNEVQWNGSRGTRSGQGTDRSGKSQTRQDGGIMILPLRWTDIGVSCSRFSRTVKYSFCHLIHVGSMPHPAVASRHLIPSLSRGDGVAIVLDPQSLPSLPLPTSRLPPFPLLA